MRPEAKVITVGELAEYLRVHRSTLYRLLKRQQLPGFKIGSDWRFNVEVIDRWRMQQSASIDERSDWRRRERTLNMDCTYPYNTLALERYRYLVAVRVRRVFLICAGFMDTS
jgi:excisionase family DNA binding protein